MKRVSLAIRSKKYPGQTFTGYALLHEFHPKRLSFFTSQKFPVDDELEVEMDYFNSHAQMKVLMTHIHEQISSGRVMNAIPSELNPFPVRKFYRCFASVNALEGTLPGMIGAQTDPAVPDPAVQNGDEPTETPAAESTQEPATVTPITAAADGATEKPAPSFSDDPGPSTRPADSDSVAAALAALSAEPKAA